jgi:hypothetical protein
MQEKISGSNYSTSISNKTDRQNENNIDAPKSSNESRVLLG